MVCQEIEGGKRRTWSRTRTLPTTHLREAQGRLWHGRGVDPVAVAVAVDVGAALDAAAHPTIVVFDVAALVHHQPIGPGVGAVLGSPRVPRTGRGLLWAASAEIVDESRLWAGLGLGTGQFRCLLARVVRASVVVLKVSYSVQVIQ